MPSEWAALSAVAAIAGFGLAFATFWLTFGGRISKAEIEATTAKTSAKDANEKVQILATSFGLYREQVASNYIHREVMREVEDRLTAAIDRLGDRVDRFIETTAHRQKS